MFSASSPAHSQKIERLVKGDIRTLARVLSIVENEAEGTEEILSALPVSRQAKLIGITGPPGAGKSTLVDALIRECISRKERVAVLCVDPSSPFHQGALLGDRIRMSEWYTHPQVYIRSLASRGSLGGLHPRIIELCEVLQAAPFDKVFIETVGVGQSEVEIAGLADITVVTVVPEAGDEVQTMKAGLMEIADVFVVNKADRPDADRFVHNLRHLFRHQAEVPVIPTIATNGTGIAELYETILRQSALQSHTDRRAWLLARRAWQVIQEHRMKDLDRHQLQLQIQQLLEAGKFQFYSFVKSQL